MASYLGRLVDGSAGRRRLPGLCDPFRRRHHRCGNRHRVPGAAGRIRARRRRHLRHPYRRALRLDRVLSYDMGGTTAKICLIEDMRPKTAKSFEVARTYRFKKGSGMPISIPVIDMVEIGAGGGSIAASTPCGRSASARKAQAPNRARLLRPGGDRPTVSDADLMLGRLDPDNFAGGSISCRPIGRAAMDRDIGAALGMDAAQAAYGLCEVVDENMANAARVHAVESGKDIGTYDDRLWRRGPDPCRTPVPETRASTSSWCRRAPASAPPSAFLLAPFSFEAVRTDHMGLSALRCGPRQPHHRRPDARGRRLRAPGDGAAANRSASARSSCATGPGLGNPGRHRPDRISRQTMQTSSRRCLRNLYAVFRPPDRGLEIELVSWAVKAARRRRRCEPITRLDRDTDVAPTGAASVRHCDREPGRRRPMSAPASRPARPRRSSRDRRIGNRDRGADGYEAIAQPDGCLLVRVMT